ncbi:uncharacterized protein K452DRAFT_341097 [Aplosporella prunicola CBS 121167]|uniref:Uncharacterized protein n=1 Tax=Aplosporella prunicola CBS 121167 TaxID=1176127 RepID=A0A6A6B1B1_9PEZI|nr:uncharacterized protein K452DRAFT_341097 [Aplosporella prunicola CBS 121167]KAF2137368.1 hypothetical protein K452DRAFT_341097 [Aplosporella prunicola CBS 121167]
MRGPLTQLLLLGSALFATTALAQHPTGSSLRDQVHQDDEFKCLLWKPERAGDAEDAKQQCRNACGTKIASEISKGGASRAVSCIGFNVKFEKQPGFDRLAGTGNCTCQNSFIEWAGENVIKALPAVAEIGCELLTTSATAILDIGSLFIPGAGEAVDGGKIAITEVAKSLKYAYGNTDKAFNAFNDWMNPCGDTSAVPADMQKVFDIVNNWPDKILPEGFKPNGKWKKGGGKRDVLEAAEPGPETEEVEEGVGKQEVTGEQEEAEKAKRNDFTDAMGLVNEKEDDVLHDWFKRDVKDSFAAIGKAEDKVWDKIFHRRDEADPSEVINKADEVAWDKLFGKRDGRPIWDDFGDGMETNVEHLKEDFKGKWFKA